MILTRTEFHDLFKMDVVDAVRMLRDGDAHWLVARFTDEPTPLSISTYTKETVTLTPMLSADREEDHLKTLFELVR